MQETQVCPVFLMIKHARTHAHTQSWGINIWSGIFKTASNLIEWAALWFLRLLNRQQHVMEFASHCPATNQQNIHTEQLCSDQNLSTGYWLVLPVQQKYLNVLFFPSICSDALRRQSVKCRSQNVFLWNTSMRINQSYFKTNTAAQWVMVTRAIK